MSRENSTSFILNPIVNITGLACRLWSDFSRDRLRKRLYWKATGRTLTPGEKRIIIDELRKLLDDAERELNGY